MEASGFKRKCRKFWDNHGNVLTILGWNKFPSGVIPKDFCYGNIDEHIIATAKLHNAHDGKVDMENTTDFNTSKPMTKGRQYFLSGHVTNLQDTRKDNISFIKEMLWHHSHKLPCTM